MIDMIVELLLNFFMLSFRSVQRESLAMLALSLIGGKPLPKALAMATKSTSSASLKAAFSFLSEGLSQGQDLQNLLLQPGCKAIPAADRAVLGADLQDREKGALLLARSIGLAPRSQQIFTVLSYFIAESIFLGLVFLSMVMFVLPQFKEIYCGMRIELPFSTQLIMMISDFLSVWLFLIGFAIIVGLLVAYIIFSKISIPLPWRHLQRMREIATLLRFMPDVEPQRVSHVLSVIGHPILFPITGEAIRAYAEALRHRQPLRTALAMLRADPLVACLLHMASCEGRSNQVLREGAILVEERWQAGQIRLLRILENFAVLALGAMAAFCSLGLFQAMVKLLEAV